MCVSISSHILYLIHLHMLKYSNICSMYSHLLLQQYKHNAQAKEKLMLEQNTKTCGKTLSENQLEKKRNKKKNGIQQLFQLKLRATCCCTATMHTNTHEHSTPPQTYYCLHSVYKYTSHNCNQNIYLLPTTLLQMFLILVRI